MRPHQFAIGLLLLATTFSGCNWGQRWGNGGFGCSPNYDACVDCDPYYGNTTRGKYARRNRRDVQQWYQNLNGPRRKRPRGPGPNQFAGNSGCGYEMGFNDCGFDYCEPCCIEPCGYECCDPCGTVCGMPLAGGMCCNDGFGGYDMGAYGGYVDDGFIVDDGSYYGGYGGGFDDGYVVDAGMGYGDYQGFNEGFQSDCPTCQQGNWQDYGDWQHQGDWQQVPMTPVPQQFDGGNEPTPSPTRPVPSPYNGDEPAPAPGAAPMPPLGPSPSPMPAPGEPATSVQQTGYFMSPQW